MGFVLWFSEISKDDVLKVGGKNASLGEMFQKLKGTGVAVPNGFALTTDAFREFISFNKLDEKLKEILENIKDESSLQQFGSYARNIIKSGNFPQSLVEEIGEAYQQLEKEFWPNVDVGVRSSAPAEDADNSSFAGQHDSFLNIRGITYVLEAIKLCFASIFNNRAISYRKDRNLDVSPEGISVGVQKMVRSDRACSGVMFTIEPKSGFKNALLINSGWGLGEPIVRGLIDPDEFLVFKPTLKNGFEPILSKRLGAKEQRMDYGYHQSGSTELHPTLQVDRNRFTLTNQEIIELARIGITLEEHYGKHMDIEWAKDGDGVNIGNGKIFIVQARPETVFSQKNKNQIRIQALPQKGEVIVSGIAAGSNIGKGKARILENAYYMESFKDGEVLVTEMTDPDWEPIMRKASAIVTNSGSRTCHAAIVAREIGVPCIVAAAGATEKINNGEFITASCAEGEIGYVYRGDLAIEESILELDEIRRKKSYIGTNIMMNLGDPIKALEQSFYPNDGIGLARLEFIVNSIGIHPSLALAQNPENILSQEDLKTLRHKIRGYESIHNFFVEKLAEGIGQIAGAVWPNDVILRTSDFKSNEYAKLLGGNNFEPKEENPMIGWRGASRYYDDRYKEAFKLELEAIKIAREKFGLTNLKVMIPFCRTPEEAKKISDILESYGFVRGQNNFQLYMMVEIPSNVILFEDFAKYFDGFSIGSNDLTQLVFGLDRDSGQLAHIADERHEAVKIMIALAIKKSKSFGKPIGICGQAPSDFPDFALFLVNQGITSISVTPDSIPRTIEAIYNEIIKK